MAMYGHNYDPNSDDPSGEELKGKTMLEKNDFLALVIAAVSVFLPVALLFIGFLLLIVWIMF